MVTGRLEGISDANARSIMYGIWGGYPRGYTACGQEVAPEQVVNLFLSSALSPYLTPKAREQVDDPVNFTSDGTDTYLGFDIKWHLPVTISGTKKLDLTNVEVWSDSKCGNDDCFRFAGEFKQGTLDLHTPYKIDVKAEVCIIGIGCSWVDVATVTVTKLKVSDVTFDIPGKGAHVYDDYSGSFCFRPGATLTKSDQKVSFTIHDNDLTCTVTPLGGPVTLPASTVCGWVKDGFVSGFRDRIGDEVHNMVKDRLLPALPRCGTVNLEPPPRVQLTVSWGQLKGQRLTARAGRSYLLRGQVTANRDSSSYEFVTFDERSTRGGATTRIASMRMTSVEGANEATTLWTPTRAGDTEILLSASRWDDPTDGPAPSVIRVRVFPDSRPLTWAEMMYERMSTSLEEAP